MKKERVLHLYRSISVRGRTKRVKRRAIDSVKIESVEVRIDGGDIRLLDRKRVCWFSKGQILTRQI